MMMMMMMMMMYTVLFFFFISVKYIILKPFKKSVQFKISTICPYYYFNPFEFFECDQIFTCGVRTYKNFFYT